MQTIRWTFTTSGNCPGRKGTKGHRAGFETVEEAWLPVQEALEGPGVRHTSGIWAS